MPFRHPQPPRSPHPNVDPERPPLLKLGGLYPSKSGKALTGNINLLYQDRQGSPSVGTQWVELLQQCVQENLPIRVLVFENNGQFGGAHRAPYTLHVCLGTPRQEQATSPLPGTKTGRTRGTGSEADLLEAPEGHATYEDAPEGEQEPDEPEPPARLRTPEPTPRPPVRRVAPRR